jgi:hypothetical protein
MAKTSTETEATEYFRTIEHFDMLKEASMPTGFDIGNSVAVLLSDDTDAKIVHGRIYGTDYVANVGMTYRVVTREGDKYANLSSGRIVKI